MSCLWYFHLPLQSQRQLTEFESARIAADLIDVVYQDHQMYFLRKRRSQERHCAANLKHIDLSLAQETSLATFLVWSDMGKLNLHGDQLFYFNTRNREVQVFMIDPHRGSVQSWIRLC